VLREELQQLEADYRAPSAERSGESGPEAHSAVTRPTRAVAALDAGDSPAARSDSLLPAGAGVLEQLGVSSVHLQLREPDTWPEVDTSASPPQPVSASGRLRIDREIARGGMGAVLRGRDIDLGRAVAIKVILEEHRDRPELVRRFVEEAQVAGQLQHPGVVPVYELGRFSDRRPFFTMKLVKGQTLATLLAERTAPSDLPRFLKVFEQVCQTMAYAHARGVIHRDLKPSNVMVGAFGEVQVMDWGLAKVLTYGATPPHAEEVRAIQTARSRNAASGAEERQEGTEAGTILGTLAYMAPEQARGEVGKLDERCDVFGLGAVLCEILTGAPPFVGSTRIVKGKHAKAIWPMPTRGSTPAALIWSWSPWRSTVSHPDRRIDRGTQEQWRTR
jgi:serine/threonine protein kinase